MKLMFLPRRLSENFSLKVYLGFLTAILAVSVIFNLLFFQWQKETLRHELISQGELLARVLAHNVVLGVFSENEAQLRPPMEAILRQQHVLSVAVYNHEGELLARAGRPHSPGKPAGEGFTSLIPAAAAASFAEDGTMLLFSEPVRFSSYASEEALYFQDASFLQEQTIGLVQVTISKDKLRKSIQGLIVRNGALAVFVLLIGGLLTYYLARDLTRPLNRLIGEVKKQGIEVESRDQLSLLSGTFEHLVNQVREAFSTIKRLNEELEIKVDERTRDLAQANEELLQRQAYLEEMNVRLEETLRQLKETQAQMVHSEKMAGLGQLVAGVAHEINNTVNFVSGALPALSRDLRDLQSLLAVYGQLDRRATRKALVEKLGEAEKLKDEIEYERLLPNLEMLLANIREGARRTGQIVKDLTTFSRPGTAEWKAVDIHEGLDSTLTLLYSEYKHQLEIIKDYQPDLPLVFCSPGHLNQVFMNLLLNAAQAIEAPGTIHIITRRTEKTVRIIIRDSGKGIPPEVQGRIFEPFFTTKPVGKGTGLGLSISYGIVKKHRGEILVRSEPGRGTEFEVVIPLTGPAEKRPAQPDSRIGSETG